ncbi:MULTISPECIES: glycosyl hydrolase family 65 protein [unclassified Mycoplasma]|uniref:glycosyl hydrolase family 65 protein n=1 Tax=unclassified Mycoplasma TaxID=2683645 RepID=UPI00211BD208|nr:MULTISPECIES: glycosyl hydrolase family 65 protein [unclassified Mycoplasma]UUM19738.1 glycoside hydrolase family 65 protein [Mycoplasma sp. 1578d]UUM24722.1 glycoside hydrolase family 65 protein [Mycoplasma sp. 3686d]
MEFLKYDLDKKTISQIKFDSTKTAKTESIFALGNGYLGIRSADEEPAIYNKEDFFVNGIFNKSSQEDVSELANLADLMTTPILLNGKQIQLQEDDEYLKTLFIKEGFLQRRVIIKREQGTFELNFERFVSQEQKNVYAQKINIKVLDLNKNYPNIKLTIIPAINGQVTNTGSQHFAEGLKSRPTKESLQMKQWTTFSKKIVVHNLITQASLNQQRIYGGNDDYLITISRRKVAFKINVTLKENDQFELIKLMSVHTGVGLEKEILPDDLVIEHANKKHNQLLKADYQVLKQASIQAMNTKVWNQFFVQIEGDSFESKYDTLALEFGIFHLNSFVPKDSIFKNVGAKGLSGEGYQGHTYWDTEFFINPNYLFTNPKIVRNLLTYRYLGLQGARNKAKEIKIRPEESNLEGAQFPWEMAWPSEGEVCPYWGQADIITGEQVPIASRRQEIHVSADVAYAINQYYQVTGDEEFMELMGYEMIIDTAYFYTNRAEKQANGEYHIKDVMGPNEYKGNIDNNAYINKLAQFNIQLALKAIEKLSSTPQGLALLQKIYQKIPYPINVDKMKIVVAKLKQQLPNQDLIIAENDQFLKLPKNDVSQFQMLGDAGKKLFNTTQGHNLLSSQLVKQADVVLLTSLFPHLYSKEIRNANFDYYESITTHDSSLSPATYAIEAARLGKNEKAYQLFKYGINIDLGNNMESSNQGIHAGSLAAIWQMIVFGFGGLDWHNDQLHIHPNLPKEWNNLKYNFSYASGEFLVSVSKEDFEIICLKQANKPLIINNNEFMFKLLEVQKFLIQG